MFVWKIPEGDFLFSSKEVTEEQGQSDLCGSYAAVSLGKDKFGIDFEPLYTNVKAVERKGNNSIGVPIEYVCQACIDYGLLPKRNYPFPPEQKDRNFLYNPANWSKDLDNIAASYKFKKYEPVIGFNSQINLIRGGMWKAKSPLFVATYWQPEWDKLSDGIVRQSFNQLKLFPHAMLAIGQKKINNRYYVICKNAKKSIGDNGIFYFDDYLFSPYLLT